MLIYINRSPTTVMETPTSSEGYEKYREMFIKFADYYFDRE